jgi:hypothetical protein
MYAYTYTARTVDVNVKAARGRPSEQSSHLAD